MLTSKCESKVNKAIVTLVRKKRIQINVYHEWQRSCYAIAWNIYRIAKTTIDGLLVINQEAPLQIIECEWHALCA